jgi:transcriptional regulator with XRE-family HTH domain
MKHIMKQPELGLKISQLRKSKGWTQEELVEKCNISVRTIQRIEAGEVTPRTYTIRTILNALDHDLEEVTTQLTENSLLERIKNGSIDPGKGRQLANLLLIASVAGIIYFVVEFFDVYIEYSKYQNKEINISTGNYLILKSTVLLTFTLFMLGFAELSRLIGNYMLKITSFMQIGLFAGIIGFDLITFFNSAIRSEDFMIGLALSQGVVLILFGMALYKSSDALDSIARYTGLLVIITGICFATVILSMVGLLLIIPAELLQIIILFRIMDQIRSKNRLIIQNEG